MDVSAARSLSNLSARIRLSWLSGCNAASSNGAEGCEFFAVLIHRALIAALLRNLADGYVSVVACLAMNIAEILVFVFPQQAESPLVMPGYRYGAGMT